MKFSAKGLSAVRAGMVFIVFIAAPAWSAPPANWNEIPTKTVTLFYPGQGGYQWLRSSKHKRAYKKVIQGDSCVSCHEGEEKDIGDLIVAGEAAQFGLPEARHGLIPGAGGTQNLPRLIGAALAKELMWTARRITAEEAWGLRIVNHVVDKGQALAKAREIVDEMSVNGPLAIMMIKQAVDRGLDMPLSQGFLQENDLSYMLGWSEDRAAGLDAFAKRTRAKFKGQ